MKFNQYSAQVFVPDGRPVQDALASTTHLAIGAHQDDLEIMAIDGILACFQNPHKAFTGVVVADGRGTPRAGLYGECTDDQMWTIRNKEQKKAAVLGEYAALVLLDYPSRVVKDSGNVQPIEDLVQVLQLARPEVVYAHNLADKHPTHVAVTLRVITAIRQLPPEERPQHLYGCEVWRDLDWMVDTDKVAFDCSTHEGLQAALVGVFDSQVVGGKRYDLATTGRRRANATYYESHATDVSTGLSFAMDLSPLIQEESLDPADYVQARIQNFAEDVRQRIAELRTPVFS
ncbi:MAG: PIG-L family deacetylase [Anaerolineae bacterium]|nr:PIG-L family deacetylase [Anaerolineae bacterium]